MTCFHNSKSIGSSLIVVLHKNSKNAGYECLKDAVVLRLSDCHFFIYHFNTWQLTSLLSFLEI